jgi:hypothetical protein
MGGRETLDVTPVEPELAVKVDVAHVVRGRAGGKSTGCR